MYILILIWVYDTYKSNTMMDYNNYDDYTLCTKQTFFLHVPFMFLLIDIKVKMLLN